MLQSRIFRIVLLLGGVCFMVTQSDVAPMSSMAQESSVSQYSLKGRRIFEPLPAGAVKPTGWLRDWAMAARNGYTSVMDDVDPEFGHAWTADFSPTCPVGDWGHGSWSYEGGGYWFDGLVRLAYQLEDEELLAMVRRRLAPVLENATPEGIGHFYWLRRKNEADLASVHPDYGWGLWASALYGRAMISYYEATGDERALRAMRCADDSSDVGCITVAGLGSPPNNTMNACTDYAHSGDAGVAETLSRFFDHCEVEWASLWEPYRTPPVEALWHGEKHYPEDWVMRFHGVFLNETLAGWAAGTLWTGRSEFLETSIAWQKLMDAKSLQPYGALVEDELYGPTGAYRCTETCTLAAELWRRIQLFTMTGVGGDADRVERLFFNAGAGTTTRDFTQHVYFQQPNRLSPNSFIYSWGNKTNGTFQRKHYPLCCTAGLNRILPTYIQYQWMKTSDAGLAAVLYAPNRLDTTIRGTPITIDSTTDYPFQETVTMRLTLNQSIAFPLLLRIPQWCKAPTVTLNGERVDVILDEHSFLQIVRTWNTGDLIELHFPMEPCLEQGIDRNARQVAMPTGGSWGQGSVLGQFANTDLSAVPYASISLGPLLFSLPIPEENGDANRPVHDAVWQYALDPNRALDAVTVERSEVPRPWAWQREAPVQLRVQACSAHWTHDAQFPHLPKSDEMELGEFQTISLIPYGCAKLRVSMFPVAETGPTPTPKAVRPLSETEADTPSTETEAYTSSSKPLSETIVEIPKITFRSDASQDVSAYAGKFIQIDSEIMAYPFPLQCQIDSAPVQLVGIPYEQQEQIRRECDKSYSEGFSDIYRLTGYLSFQEDWYTPPKDVAGTPDHLKPRVLRTYFLVVRDIQKTSRTPCPTGDPFEEDSPMKSGTNDPSSNSDDPFAAVRISESSHDTLGAPLIKKRQ